MLLVLSLASVHSMPFLFQVMSFGNRADTLSLKDQASAESLAVFLDSILGQIDAVDVVFSIGNYSGAVAASLEGLPSAHHRRKVHLMMNMRNVFHQLPWRMSLSSLDRVYLPCVSSLNRLGSSAFLLSLLTAHWISALLQVWIQNAFLTSCYVLYLISMITPMMWL